MHLERDNHTRYDYIIIIIIIVIPWERKQLLRKCARVSRKAKLIQLDFWLTKNRKQSWTQRVGNGATLLFLSQWFLTDVFTFSRSGFIVVTIEVNKKSTSLFFVCISWSRRIDCSASSKPKTCFRYHPFVECAVRISLRFILVIFYTINRHLRVKHKGFSGKTHTDCLYIVNSRFVSPRALIQQPLLRISFAS